MAATRFYKRRTFYLLLMLLLIAGFSAFVVLPWMFLRAEPAVQAKVWVVKRRLPDLRDRD